MAGQLEDGRTASHNNYAARAGKEGMVARGPTPGAVGCGRDMGQRARAIDEQELRWAARAMEREGKEKAWRMRARTALVDGQTWIAVMTANSAGHVQKIMGPRTDTC